MIVQRLELRLASREVNWHLAHPRHPYPICGRERRSESCKPFDPAARLCEKCLDAWFKA